jgi:glyoxylase-like metal-dependent hydrolase (beta-lactamase superfamily II)
VLALLVLASATLAPTALGQESAYPPDPFQIEVEEVADGVYLAYRPNAVRLPVEGNAVFIVNNDDVVVVDGSGTPLTARRVIEHIRDVTPNPVSILINTHWHGDHNAGNHEYKQAFPDVQIIAHSFTRHEMANGRLSYIADQARDPEGQKEQWAKIIEQRKKEGLDPEVVAWAEDWLNVGIDATARQYSKVQVTVPDVAFDERMVLYRGDRSIEIRFFGRGDTPGDAVVYLPQDRVVITGDMVTQPVPYGYSDHPLEWRRTLEKVAELEFDVLIPGHGAAQQGSSYLESLIDLLSASARRVEAAVREGVTRDAITEEVDMSDLEEKFAGDDPLLRNRFEIWFRDPNLPQTYDAVLEARDAASRD